MPRFKTAVHGIVRLVRGTIRSVPAGSGRHVMILGRDADGHTVVRGEKSNIRVDANTENDAGTMDCYPFIPVLQSPADETKAAGYVIKLVWESAAGANSCEVVVSPNSATLTDPAIKETTTSSFYECFPCRYHNLLLAGLFDRCS